MKTTKNNNKKANNKLNALGLTAKQTKEMEKKWALESNLKFEKEMKMKTNFWALIYMTTIPSPRTGSIWLQSTIIMTKVFKSLKSKKEMYLLAKKETIKRNEAVVPVLISDSIYSDLFGGVRMNKMVDNVDENGGPLYIQPDVYPEEYRYIIEKNKELFQQAFVVKYDPCDDYNPLNK